MERSANSMDDEWELLPVPSDDHDTSTGHRCTLFEFGLESEKDLLFSNQTNFFGPVAVLDNHYFILPSSSPRPSNVNVLLNHHVESSVSREEDEEQHIPVVEFKDIGVVPQQSPPPQLIAATSRAVFDKLKDDELDDDDMSVWYPNFSPRERKIVEPTSCDAKEEEEEEEEKDRDKKRRRKRPCWEGFGLKVGALCSVGAAAAATVCILVLGGGHLQLNHDKYSQRLQFQIYADDKGIKQAVQQASRLNCTLTAARGVRMRTAHISFGGHYKGF